VSNEMKITHGELERNGEEADLAVFTAFPLAD